MWLCRVIKICMYVLKVYQILLSVYILHSSREKESIVVNTTILWWSCWCKMTTNNWIKAWRIFIRNFSFSFSYINIPHCFVLLFMIWKMYCVLFSGGDNKKRGIVMYRAFISKLPTNKFNKNVFTAGIFYKVSVTL